MIKAALQNLNITALNPMQNVALNVPVQSDMILLSPTGSGKTLGFLLPVLGLLDKETIGVQALILVPSRELALQIEKVFKTMGTGFKVSCCYGGHPTRVEKNSLSQPPAVLIGTPGRIAYHVRNESFDATTVHTLVLDEFDKALEFGFQEDMAYIIHNLTGLKKRILTSATRMDQIPAFTGVTNPVELDFLKDVVTKPDLQIKAVLANAEDKLSALFALICKIGSKATLVFCNHRDAVDRISELLNYMGLIHGVFHGGMEQEDRELALLRFRNGSNRLLITTDLASRGLDIPEIEAVIHYQLPHNEEAFVHRNGRTARMHAKGISYLILLPNESLPYLPKPEMETLPEKNDLPKPTEWETIYVSAGKKDKVNKVDIVGLLLQKGGLQKDELGLIEVHDHASYAAIKRNRIEATLQKVRNEKVKGRKAKIEIAR